MPFVQRVVTPVFISRSQSQSRAHYNARSRTCCITTQKSSQNSPSSSSSATTTTTTTIAITTTTTHTDVDCKGLTAAAAEPNPSPSYKPTTIYRNRNNNHLVELDSSSSSAASPAAAKDLQQHSIHSISYATDVGDEEDTAVPVPVPSSCDPQSSLTGYELESISNLTLSNALRQLASLVIIANDIFLDLNKELQSVGERSKSIKERIDGLGRRVGVFDPKLVTVPVSDLGTFAQRKTHFETVRKIDKELFTPASRPNAVNVLYEEAAKNAVHKLEASEEVFDSHLRPHHPNCTGPSTAELVCTPVFGKANRKMRTKIDAEIEIRLPAAIDDLRKWTSAEALGDVTVTPDCVNRVDTSIITLTNIGENGILTSALSPSVLSADAVDALYSINSTSNDSSHYPNEICKDVPLNHRLPSPEEQCLMIALKYPAEVISVNTSGRCFERMSMARKSTAGCFVNIGDENNLNEDIQTVSRRSRSRKVRGKRRNTIAGIDQKEIQDAAIGESNSPTTKQTANNDNDDEIDDASSRFGRSHSSDVLKNNDSNEKSGKTTTTTLTRLNSLKQWGRNRFKFIIRNDIDAKHQKTPSAPSTDIDESCTVSEIVAMAKTKNDFFEKEGRFSHERKPSYSSSEKSVSVTMTTTGKLPAMNVKLRDTSSLNRQRRNNGFAAHKDEPHSSSGNWSASSESGRASIGSEITIQPKSSASNTSLNNSSFHPGSGPPSSIISRRRFMNTSASSSVTSDGTATPDLQVNDVDDETSSAYSCDTEGYYTSFHMDSGLRTLKEEEPMTPLHVSSVHPSNYSFGSISNQTMMMMTAENEYELFGRGSTSTTTSSAGTVVTALLAADHAPDVPERISSLSKLNTSASTSTLERSYSSSTIGSTLERTGTIKRNVAAAKKDTTVVAAVVHDTTSHQTSPETPESCETEFDFNTRSAAECSESSDFEGVERIERIKQKTAMNSQRIPSMCIITPTTSDDENFKTDQQPPPSIDINLNNLKQRSTSSLNTMFDKLKVVLPNMKNRSPSKRASVTAPEEAEDIYDIAGEYVTIADISNNNNNNNKPPGTKLGNLGIYYSNDVVRQNLATVLSGNLKRETEYVSLNELPCTIRGSADVADSSSSQCARSTSNTNCSTSPSTTPSPMVQNKGARVKMNAQGRIIYDSDSLKRRKGAHTTFAPGPCVKETESALDITLTTAPPVDAIAESESHSSAAAAAVDIDSNQNRKTLPAIISGGCANRKLGNIRPVVSHKPPTIVNMTTKCFEMPSPPPSTVLKAQDYQHLAKPVEASNPAPFSRNQPQYWTLQNRRPAKTTSASTSSRDDLYATPINKLNRTAILRSDVQAKTTTTNISPIVPRNMGSFHTSTPTKDTTPEPTPKSLWSGSNDNQQQQQPERQNTCSDRIGNSKTTLMDFKKLLLAKSTKTNPVQKKLSAVELLKINKAREAAEAQAQQAASQPAGSNSSMTLLDLSGSPKTFANRRMLRQGQFGSPSKTFMSKQRSAAWRMNAIRTDVMSTTIPEANSEDDHSSTSGSSKANSETGEQPPSSISADNNIIDERRNNISEESIDLKRNIFLQTEENNFMKGELKSQFLRSSTNHTKLISSNNSNFGAKSTTAAKLTIETIHNDATTNKEANNFPALETAL